MHARICIADHTLVSVYAEGLWFADIPGTLHRALRIYLPTRSQKKTKQKQNPEGKEEKERKRGIFWNAVFRY